jgi:thiol-disulfide isomerase/thioredoxin
MHFDRRSTLMAALALAVLLAACSAAVEVLPQGEISLQTSEAEAEQQAEVAEASEQATVEVAIDAGQSVVVQPAIFDLNALPMILPGSPDFHASRVEDFALASGQVQLVEFFAYWCAVCKAIAPTVHGLENIYGDHINFVYLDRDDPNTFQFQEQLGYIYQPHFFLLDPNGFVLGQWRGYVDGVELQRALVSALQ